VDSGEAKKPKRDGEYPGNKRRNYLDHTPFIKNERTQTEKKEKGGRRE